jgi:hypothetical protein
MRIIVNTEAANVNSAIVDDIGSITSATIPTLVVGDKVMIELYFVDNTGTYVEWSGENTLVKMVLAETGAQILAGLGLDTGEQWTTITDGYKGILNLRGQELLALIGTSSTKQLTCGVQVEFIDTGEIRTFATAPVTVRWDPIVEGAPEPTPNVEWATQSWVSAYYYEKTETYTKTEVDTALGLKANSADVYAKTETYTRTEVDYALGLKANASNVYTKSETYTKTEVDTALGLKANSADVYTKTEVDTALGLKANASNVYTKTEVDTALGLKANASNVYTKSETYTKTEVNNITGAIITTISSTTTWYIDGTNGNDTTGDGSVGAPWATIDKLVTKLATTVINAPLTVKINTGNYTPSSGIRLDLDCVSMSGLGSLTITKYDTASITGVRLRMDLYCKQGATFNDVTLGGLRILAPISFGANIRFMPFTEWTAGSYPQCINMYPGGTLTMSGSTISIESQTHGTGRIITQLGGVIQAFSAFTFAAAGGTVTLPTGDTSAGFIVSNPGSIFNSTVVPTVTGTWVGKRYNNSGQIRVVGGSTTSLPGDTAGSNYAGGAYYTT